MIPTSIFIFLGVVVAVVVVALVAIVLLCLISLWKIFKKAGLPGWAALIPFYNKVKILEMTNRPLWWVVLSFIPVVNVVIGILVLHRLAVVFGKGWGFTLGIILLPFIFLPILAFGKAQYMNVYPSAAPMSEAVKWSLIAAFVACIVMPLWSLRGLGEFHPGLSIIHSDSKNDSYYVTDGRYVYSNDELILGANPRTFRLLGGDYAVDRGLAFYGGEIIAGAHATTFHVVMPTVDIDTSYGSSNIIYATDGRTVYYQNTPVVGADPKTFVAAWGTTTPAGNAKDDYVDYDGKDVNHFYYSGKVIQ